jgi:hypothetical protein
LAVLLALPGLLAGCAHGSKQVKAERCAEARTEATGQTGHLLRGDVDGDGVPDRVSLVRLRSDAPCGAVLVVRTRARTLTRALPTTSGAPGVPLLNGLASLAPNRPLQIVLTTWLGASTEFARVFAVRKGQISELAAPTADGTFPYEGSVTHFNAIDCVHGRPGMIVASGWFERESGSFGFERHFYRVGAGRLALVRSQSGKTRIALPETKVFREFREPQPFPSCMRVRAE